MAMKGSAHLLFFSLLFSHNKTRVRFDACEDFFGAQSTRKGVRSV